MHAPSRSTGSQKKMQPKVSQQHVFEKIFHNVFDVVNEVKIRIKGNREFPSFCNDMLADHETLKGR